MDVLRFVGQMLYPLPVSLFLSALGLSFLWFTQRQRTGRILATAGFVLLLLASVGAGNSVLARIERACPVMSIAELPQDNPITHVVVLSASYNPDPTVPLSARPSATFLARLVEGIRVHRAMPGTKLIVTAGVPTGASDARVTDIEQLAAGLGVKPQDITVVPGARSTAEEADTLQPILQGNKIVVVTSASHMPRALEIFRRRGLDPIGVPTGHLISAAESGVLDAMPSVGGLRRTHTLVYEGLAWAKAALFR